jgi:hypothetical protein
MKLHIRAEETDRFATSKTGHREVYFIWQQKLHN